MESECISLVVGFVHGDADKLTRLKQYIGGLAG